MPILIEALPDIVEILGVDDVPHFVVLAYNPFVRTVGDGLPVEAPDVVAVLDHEGQHAFVILRYDAFCDYVRRAGVEGRIDEEHYLKKYDDIRAAVDAGALGSGTEHYIIQGYFERREARPIEGAS